MYGPKILKVLNKQSKGLPTIPKKPLSAIEKITGIEANPFSGMGRANIVDGAKIVQKYPNLFRNQDVKANVIQALDIKKALKLYDKNKTFTYDANQMKKALPTQWSPISRGKARMLLEDN